jgi:organic radical activating enzyme
MKLRVSEVFESIQGEGKSAGEPALFVRLALCNLRCVFCDSRYAWDFSTYSYEEEVSEQTIEELTPKLLAASVGRLIVTGGEPLLQQPALEELLEQLGSRFFVEVETNGTICPSHALVVRVGQWNVSPKLSNSGEPAARRLNSEALHALLQTDRAYLKLVLSAQTELSEATALVEELGWPPARVLLMPRASTREELSLVEPVVRELAARAGYGYSPRLHVERFGGERGR